MTIEPWIFPRRLIEMTVDNYRASLLIARHTIYHQIRCLALLYALRWTAHPTASYDPKGPERMRFMFCMIAGIHAVDSGILRLRRNLFPPPRQWKIQA